MVFVLSIFSLVLEGGYASGACISGCKVEGARIDEGATFDTFACEAVLGFAEAVAGSGLQEQG